MKSRIFTPVRSALVAFACVASFMPRASAQTISDWGNTGPDGAWSNSLNWTNPPTDGAAYATNILRFFGNTNYFSTNDFTLSVPFQLNGLFFNNIGAATNGNAVNLSGGALQFLANGAANPGITNSGNSAVNIANAIDISATALNLAGNNTFPAGVVTTNTLSGDISGSGGITKSGSNIFVLSGNNSFAGDTIVTAGTLRGIITSNNSTVFGTSATIRPQGGTLTFLSDLTNMTVGAGSGYNVLSLSNNNGVILVDRLTTATSNLVYRLNNLSVSNSTIGVTANNGSQLIFDGATTMGGTAAVFNVTAGLASLNGAISDGGGTTAFRKIGAGRLAITNGLVPAYGGLTLVDAGQLQVNSTVLTPAPLPGTDIYLRGGAIEFRTTNSQIVGPGAGYNFMVTANGSTINSDRIPTSAASSGTNTITINNITFAPNSVGLGVALTSIGTNLTFTTGNSNTIRVVGTTTMATNTQLSVGGLTIIDGLITDTNGGLGTPFSLRKTGAGRLFITNTAVSNLYTGGTIIDQGFLQVNATTNNPANLGPGNLTLRGGTLEIRTTNSQAFGPGTGYAVTVITNSTISVDRFGTTAGTNIIDLGPVTVSQVSTTATTLTVAGANAYSLRVPSISFNTNLTLNVGATNFIVTGALTEVGGSYTLTKTGVGRLSLTNGVDQSYTGGTLINAGFVQVTALTNNPQPLGTGLITLNGGTLELRSDLNTTWGAGLGYNFNVTNGGGTIDLNRITTTGGTNIFFVNNINLTTNTGTLTVTGNNSDVLMVNGAVVGSVSGVPQYTLSGTGPGNLISNNIINIAGNGALVFTNPFTFNGSNSVSGLRLLNTTTFGGTTTDHVLNTPAGTLIFAGPVTNDGINPITSFTHLGGGTAVFSNTVTFGAATAVTNNAGGLQFFGTNNVMNGITINAGTILGNGDLASGNTPFGSGPIIINGGTVQYRSRTNIVIGPGAGYTNIVNSNATINVDNTLGTAAANDTITIGQLSIKSARLNVTGGNGDRFAVAGTTTISGKTFINAATGVTLRGQLLEGTPGSQLIKEGASNLFYTSTLSALHSGGTIITNGNANINGNVLWRPANTLTSGNVLQFGSGPITLDGNSTFGFQPATTVTNTFTTPFIIADKVSSGQIIGDGGGQINYASVGGSPITTNTGAITLSGNLKFNGAGNTGSTTPIIITGGVTISGDNREITALNRANAGNDRYIIRGNITGDGTYSNLTLRANQFANIELGATGTGNVGVNNIDIVPSYQGANGRVRFATSNSLPGGKVTVESSAAVAIGFNTTNFNGIVTTGISGLATKFNFLPDSVLALEGVKPESSVVIDLSATGLNADVRIGAFEGVNYSLSNSITPFATTFKLGGGNGTLTMAGVSQLTGANSLSVNPNPYAAPVANLTAGTVDFGSTVANNSYSGGTIVNGGTLIVRSGGANTALGSGAVDVYGTLSVLSTNGSLANAAGTANNNVIRLQPGSQLTLGETGSTNNNRWADSVDLKLMGGRANLVGRIIPSFTNTETIGNLNYALGSRLQVLAQNSSNFNSTVLTVASLTRVGNGTIDLLRNNANVTNINNVEFGAQSKIIATTAPTVVNGMISPSIINQGNAIATDSSFVTYSTGLDTNGATIGVTNATYTTTSLATSTLTDILDVANQPVTTNFIVLTAPVNAYAMRALTNGLRGGQDITLAGGGLISGAVNHDSRFIFGSLATPAEGLVYLTGTAVFSNDFVASGITKFGNGQMSLLNNRSYANGWNVNWGNLSVGSSNALGTSVAGNTVRLNNGQNSVALLFVQNLDAVSYTSGPIISLDNNTIQVNTGAAGRSATIAPMGLTLDTVSAGPLGSRLLFQAAQDRTVARIGGNLTLNTDAYLDLTSTVAGRVSGASARLDVGGNLVASGRTINKYGIGGLGLMSDNSATFTGSTLNVNYGSVHVGNNAALGGAGTVVNIRSNAVFEIDAALTNYSNTGGSTLNQDAGSAERWLGAFNRFNNNTSAETFNVVSGRMLQVAADMATVTNKTIDLAADSGLEAYRQSDSAGAASLTIGRSMIVNLSGDAKIGQGEVDMGLATQMNVLANITESGGSRSLTKVGLNADVLAGNNTYTGGTRVQRGTLLVNNGFQTTLVTNQYGVQVSSATSTNGSATGTGAVTVVAQAMLGGTNGAIAGPVTVQTGGTLMPGNLGTVSTILLETNLTFQIGSFFDVDVATSNSVDMVIVKGDVAAGGATLNIRLGANIPANFTNTLVVINNLGLNPIAGAFAGLNNGDIITFMGNDSTNNFSASFTYHFNDSGLIGYENDLVLTAGVPEPGTTALMVIGAALCGLHVMRRRRS